MLTHPNYGGACVHGRTGSAWDCEGGLPRRGVRHRPRERWHSLIPDAHEGCVSWERFERIQETLAVNDQRGSGAGAPKKGSALLAGLLRCRRCGRKLTVRYAGPRHDALRYCCHRGWMDNGEPRCIAFGGAPLDEAIAREVLQAVQPGVLEAAAAAAGDAERRRDEAADALRRDLEAARYEVDLASRRYDAVDPANRLVADALETSAGARCGDREARRRARPRARRRAAILRPGRNPAAPSGKTNPNAIRRTVVARIVHRAPAQLAKAALLAMPQS